MTFALSWLLLISVSGCLSLTILVVGRKRNRDHGESLFGARRAHVRAALLTMNRTELRTCLTDAISDIDAQVDLSVTIDALWPELDDATVDCLHEVVTSSGLAAALPRSLGSRSPAVRGRAVLLLSRLRWPGSTRLIAPLLHDRDGDVRLTAAGALGAIADAEAARALIEALAAEALPSERILERLGAPWAVDALLEALAVEASTRPRAHGRSLPAHLAVALGLAGDPRAEPVLMEYLASGEVEERVSAARALGTAGTLHAAVGLRHAMDDVEWTVRAQAAKSLGTLRATDAVPVLEAALSDAAWWVRSNSATALRTLGEPGLEALRHALRSGDRYARDRAREALDLAAVGEVGAQ
jgi:HEAT repeat protein